jgi:malic enzyme
MTDEFRERALDYHRHPVPGKLQIQPTKRMVNQLDLALAYSPRRGWPSPVKKLSQTRRRQQPTRPAATWSGW